MPHTYEGRCVQVPFSHPGAANHDPSTPVTNRPLRNPVSHNGPGPALQADIYEWEWIDPGSHSLGKQPSTTVCPDGAGLTPAPGMNAASKGLTLGYLIGYNLTGAYFGVATLTDADFTNATLTGADFSGATIAGTDFASTTGLGFTQAQFESTASYASGDLTGVGLFFNDLTGWVALADKQPVPPFFNGLLTAPTSPAAGKGLDGIYRIYGIIWRFRRFYIPHSRIHHSFFILISLIPRSPRTRSCTKHHPRAIIGYA